jgi:hypothetical protein
MGFLLSSFAFTTTTITIDNILLCMYDESNGRLHCLCLLPTIYEKSNVYHVDYVSLVP